MTTNGKIFILSIAEVLIIMGAFTVVQSFFSNLNLDVFARLYIFLLGIASIVMGVAGRVMAEETE